MNIPIAAHGLTRFMLVLLIVISEDGLLRTRSPCPASRLFKSPLFPFFVSPAVSLPIMADAASLRAERIGASSAPRALAHCHDWKITTWTPIVMPSLRRVYACSGRVAEGVSWLRQALGAYEAMGMVHLHSISVAQLAETHLLAGELEDARACPDRAVMLTRERAERGYEAWALRVLGEIAAHRGGPNAATSEARYSVAMALATELGHAPARRPLPTRPRPALRAHG
jgi:hypothetical protein